LKIRCIEVIFVSSTLTLVILCHVSALDFLDFFDLFLEFCFLNVTCHYDMVPWQRQCDVAVVMPRVIIRCEKSQCRSCICYFFSIWSQFF